MSMSSVTEINTTALGKQGEMLSGRQTDGERSVRCIPEAQEPVQFVNRSKVQIEKFATVYPLNARPIQPLNDRVVLKSK